LELEFELGSRNLVHISDVYLNEHGPLNFIIDTGARATSISVELVKKLGLKTYDSDSSVSKRLKLPHKSTRIDRLKIGSEVFEDEEILVLNLESCCGTAEGVIGFTTLKHFKMSLDYVQKTIKLERPSGLNQTGDHIDWIPLQYVNGSHLFEVPVVINDTGTHSFVLDTGAGSSVIDPETAKELGLSLAPVPGMIVRGLRGDNPGYQTVVDNISIGQLSRESFPFIAVSMEAICGCSGDKPLARNGIVGFNFLKDIELVIDYPNERYAFIEGRKDN
jgi:predicted aspartyl protease